MQDDAQVQRLLSAALRTLKEPVAEAQAVEHARMVLAAPDRADTGTKLTALAQLLPHAGNHATWALAIDVADVIPVTPETKAELLIGVHLWDPARPGAALEKAYLTVKVTPGLVDGPLRVAAQAQAVLATIEVGPLVAMPTEILSTAARVLTRNALATDRTGLLLRSFGEVLTVTGEHRTEAVAVATALFERLKGRLPESGVAKVANALEFQRRAAALPHLSHRDPLKPLRVFVAQAQQATNPEPVAPSAPALPWHRARGAAAAARDRARR